MDGILSHQILKNHSSIMKTYRFKLDHSMDSSSKDEKFTSSIKTMDLADDTTSVTITRSDSLQSKNKNE
ncbi:hypothetical protein Gotur_007706 [Gossypium turneri]